MRSQPAEPTATECTDNAVVWWGVDVPDKHGRRRGTAAWYPQMGGYVAKCVIEPLGGCFEVWVWHDGEFPFSDGTSPVELHHCCAEQFIAFGNLLAKCEDEEGQ